MGVFPGGYCANCGHMLQYGWFHDKATGLNFCNQHCSELLKWKGKQQ